MEAKLHLKGSSVFDSHLNFRKSYDSRIMPSLKIESSQVQPTGVAGWAVELISL